VLAEVGIFSDNLLLGSYTTRPFSLMHPEPEEKQWTLFAADVRNARRFTLTSTNSSSKFTTFLLYPKIILNLMLLRTMFNLREAHCVYLSNTRRTHNCSVTYDASLRRNHQFEWGLNFYTQLVVAIFISFFLL